MASGTINSDIAAINIGNITSTVTLHQNLSDPNGTFLVRQYGKVVNVTGMLKVTASIGNGTAIITGLPSNGVPSAHEVLINIPIRTSIFDVSVPTKYTLFAFRGNSIINATQTLSANDWVAFNITYIAT